MCTYIVESAWVGVSTALVIMVETFFDVVILASSSFGAVCLWMKGRHSNS